LKPICSRSVNYAYTLVGHVVIEGIVKRVLVVLNFAANGTSGENVILVDWSQITVSLVVFDQIDMFFRGR